MTRSKALVLSIAVGFLGCAQPRNFQRPETSISVRYHWDDPAKESWSLELREETIQVDDVEQPFATFDLSRIEENARGGRRMPDMTMPVSLLIRVRDGDDPTEVIGNFMRLLETLNKSGHRYTVSLKTEALEQGVSLRTSVVPRGDGTSVILSASLSSWDGQPVSLDDVIRRTDGLPFGDVVHVNVSQSFLRRPGGFPLLHRLLAKLNRCETNGTPLHLYSLTILRD